jgi:excisionase family DNA binding protein
MSDEEVPMGVTELLKPSDVAGLLNVNGRSVLRWIRQGKLAALKTPGGQYRIDPRAVDALLAQLPPAA